MRAATTTAVDATPAFHARFGAAVGLPRYDGESASTTMFRGRLGVHRDRSQIVARGSIDQFHYYLRASL